MNDETVIKVEGVSKVFRLPHEKNNSIKGAVINFYKRKRTYEKQKALEDVSFEIKKGEFFGIVGRNGSGKSTLLKMLAGIYTPSKGTIHVTGKLTPFIELGVGFSPDLTGRENVFLNGALLGFSRKEMENMYDEIVKFAELKRFMDQKLKNYSSGMQVRLAFAIAVQAKSAILLLDEVLAVGDSAFQQKCYNYFEKLKREKKTIVFVTHDMDAVQRFCDRALMLEGGVTKIQGDPSRVADTYRKDNIDQVKLNRNDALPTSGSSISLRVINETEDKKQVTLEIKYRSSVKSEVYVGFSILKNGISFAELNNLNSSSMVKKNTLKYVLDLSMLNPGVYELGAALFEKENREPLAITLERSQIVVEGYDKTRGGGLKLKENWLSK